MALVHVEVIVISTLIHDLILTKLHYHNKYFIQLTACGVPEEGFAECCFEDEPLFYMITIIDHVANKDMVIIIHYVIKLSSFFSSSITGQSI